MKEFYGLFLFIAICFIGFVLFKNLPTREGMTNKSPTTEGGIAGNSSSYAATLKAETIKHQDVLLISKYRSEYESAILNLDDLINNLMLNEALTVDPSNPLSSIDSLAKMQQAKVALNSVMKFVDGQ
jgi:hypothetical protein